MNSLDEKKKTAINTKAEILDARVVANYGDPGLDEDYHFDILSRYVIVMIESCDRIITKDKWFKMLAVVQRPQHLWIQTTGGVTMNTTSQKRVDAQGNVNVGLSSNYSVRGISRINPTYALGDRIKIRKLPLPSTATNNATLFQSDFKVWNPTVWSYGGWHSDGSNLPYINNDASKVSSLRQKTVEPIAGDPNWLFNFYLNKYQYEVFMLSIEGQITTTLTQIFGNNYSGGSQVYSGHGGYVFSDSESYVLLAGCEYEDINLSNRMRTGSSDCVPLVVTTPNTFPTPKVRAVGTIAYNPTYSPVSR